MISITETGDTEGQAVSCGRGRIRGHGKSSRSKEETETLVKATCPR